MSILEFMHSNPWLTFFIVVVVCHTIYAITTSITGRKGDN